MTHFQRLILTLSAIFISLIAGYCCRQLTASSRWPLSAENLEKWRLRLQNLAIFFLMPFSAMLSLWGLPSPESSLLFLPLLGVAAYTWGGIQSVWFARILKLDRKQTGSFYCCGSFTNIGAVGGLVCLIFLGENSIALVALYRLLEEIYYFSISFPIARWYSLERQPLSFRHFTFSPALWIIICALSAGIVLNLTNVNRPDYMGMLASISLFSSTVLLLLSIGASLRLSSILGFLKCGVCMSFIKFIGAPALIIFMAWLMGYGSFDNGITLKTVAILSSMPVAMTALIPPSLFGLDVDLANACWIITTCGLLVIIPALLFFLPLL